MTHLPHRIATIRVQRKQCFITRNGVFMVVDLDQQKLICDYRTNDLKDNIYVSKSIYTSLILFIKVYTRIKMKFEKASKRCVYVV